MATLGAYDIACLDKEPSGLEGVGIKVVTYGAPRTGNRAFSKEYIGKVPDTWHVINAKVSPSFISHVVHVICCL